MKVVIIAAILLTVFAMLTPCLVLGAPLEQEIEPDTQYTPENTERPESNTAHETLTPVSGCDVNVLMGDETVVMDIEKYLVGVVAGEMPVTFEEEALKAHAAAARTYTLYKLWVEPSDNHDADVCTDPGCCKAYSDETMLREKWGDEFEANIAKIEMAVWETQGMYMVYDGEPVLAVFHSSSSGATENSGNVWNRDVPYLVSVLSPEGSDEVTNYITTTEVSYDEFKNTVLENYPEADFSSSEQDWVTDIVYSESGRINSAVIGGVEIPGTEIRSMFSLRSTAVSVAMGAKGVVFTVTGYGHGVGMSQYGANCLAKEGKTWQEILRWYYSGVDFASMLTSI